ncbi:IQ calmodulin-binding motif family protein [Tritrichomonas foetus]|uniref:IQ calmodulin-binding motif family protein n=1 Tax=Tritrichomonas foetus TaxID=1144522 RepID=A0A1J4JXV1_9EUKA|nr:IQ calmodulin-binding motif family protein [Tritrichomonas foetus]|eukprot:OHT03985.1 IQ calmodulin-binding motif family protein [Tritrichomonas foetus]
MISTYYIERFTNIRLIYPMTQSPDDAINTVLLDARRQLRELQNTLNDPAVEYSQVLSQFSETTNRLQNEAESLTASTATESALIPLTGPKKKPVLIQKPQNTAPKEYRPFKVNKTSNLRRQLAPKVQRQRNLPKLQPEDKNLSAAELIAMGKIKGYDDVGELLPMIDGKPDVINAPIFPTIQIDIKGAARAFRERKVKQKEKAAMINNAIQELSITPIRSEYRPSTATKEVEEEEEVFENKLSPDEIEGDEIRHPRIYEELQDEFAYQTLLVVRGKIARETPDFESFKRTNQINWEKIDSVLSLIESFCEKYEIQFAEINGRKLGEAALLSIVTENDVRSCLVGVDEFIKKKQDAAAIVIQNFWRRILELQKQEERKFIFRAAFTIQTFWRNMLDKKQLLGNIKEKLASVDQRAFELSQTLLNQYSEIEKNNYVVVHVIASHQDLTRCFDLMYKNAEIILMLPKIPAAHIWEEFVELLAQCGVPDANSRLHFIILREGDGISNRLMCDMKSVQLARRFICGRNAFLVPHADWSPERTFSVDIGLPIFGVTDTTEYQSRAAIRSIFNEAGIVPTFSTHESRDLAPLIDEALDLMHQNNDITRWIIRLGFTQSESGIGWFELTNEFLNDSSDLGLLFRKSLHCVGSVQSFLNQIKYVGATVEGIPQNVHSFPTVSLLLTGNEIRVLGTFDRLHYAPFRFACNLVPCVSVYSEELLAMAKQVGAVLLKKKIIGYVMIDFLAFKEENEIRILGFDIRLNAYPGILSTAYMNLCCGYKSEKNKMVMLKSVNCESKNAKRFAIIQNCLTHPAFPVVSTKELKRVCFSQGLMFDLLNRTGFRIVFYDSPAEGKNYSISAGLTPTAAIDKLEKSYGYLLRYLNQKVGSDSTSSIAHALISVRHFKARVQF